MTSDDHIWLHKMTVKTKVPLPSIRVPKIRIEQLDHLIEQARIAICNHPTVEGRIAAETYYEGLTAAKATFLAKD